MIKRKLIILSLVVGNCNHSLFLQVYNQILIRLSMFSEKNSPIILQIIIEYHLFQIFKMKSLNTEKNMWNISGVSLKASLFPIIQKEDRRRHHGSWHPPQGPKGSAQGAQEAGHLPEAVGQAVQVSRQTNYTFNQVVLKTLFMSRTKRPPLSLFRMIQKTKLPGRENTTTVVVGTMCGFRSCPNWRCVRRAWPAGLAAALDSPRGCGTALLAGPLKGRKVYRPFRKAPETQPQTLRPLQGPEVRRARGRPASQGYKN